jgi:hypothetical protein
MCTLLWIAVVTQSSPQSVPTNGILTRHVESSIEVEVVVIAADWNSVRKSNADALCATLSPWKCDVFPAVRGDTLSEMEFHHHVKSGKISCTAVSKSVWDLLLAVTPHGPILDFLDIDHQLATSAGRIGCALSHVSVLERFVFHNDTANAEGEEREERERERKAEREDLLKRGKRRGGTMRGRENAKDHSHPNAPKPSDGLRFRYLLILEDDAIIHDGFTFRRDLMADLRVLHERDIPVDTIDLLNRRVASHMPNNKFFMRNPRVTPHMIR